jgi:hypothetical protein
MKVSSWTMKEDVAGAVIDAAKHLPLAPIGPIPYLSAIAVTWRTAENYMEWAREGLHNGNQRGYDSALMYAKRAICRRIDGFLLYNHLRKFEGENYSVKLDALRNVGISAPDVLHELIIDPRNKTEHQYQEVVQKDARHAVEVADLFVHATAKEAERSAVVAFNWNISTGGSSFTELEEFGEFPMLLVDVFQEPKRVKIIRPVDGEVQYAELANFTKDEAIEFAQFMRTLYDSRWEDCKRDTAYYLRVIKAARI